MTDRDVVTQPEMPPAESRMWPGRRLRATREKMGLSQEEVAESLHQKVSLIRALEEDNYDKLPGQTYVYGYLRGYAKLLGLPADEILETVYADSADTPALLPQNINYKSEHYLQEPSRFYVVVIILTVCLIGSVIWVLS